MLEDKMLSVIDVGMNKDELGNKSYTDLVTGEKVMFISDCEASKFINAPQIYKRMYKRGESFYISSKNTILSYMKNHINMFSLNNNDKYYYSYMISFPSTIETNHHDRRTIMAEAVDATTDKKVYNLIGELGNYKIDPSIYYYEGDIKSIKIKSSGKDIKCAVIDGTYIINVNGNKRVYNSLLEVETYLKAVLIDNEYVTVSNVNQVMEPLFKLIDSYMNVDSKDKEMTI